MAEAVKVIVRCRPLNKRERDLKCKEVVQINSKTGQCDLASTSGSDQSKCFTFDGAYGIESTTEQIYNEIVFPLVECVVEGYNGTVFAYGQTGCGKSFTMQGVPVPNTQRGIIPRAFEHIFEAISLTEKSKFLVHASYLEIYNEEIRDLLGTDHRKKLELKEHPDNGVYVGDLSKHPVHDVYQCEKLMEQGWQNRSVGATLMNADSSRSHSIFTVYIERMCDDGLTNNNSTEEKPKIRRGKLNLVDLAGSERQAKTGASGDRLKEATKINLSLSALGNVISALVDGKQKHIPYRDSKLTRLLQDSLGGNTKTLMIACLSPADNNYDETLSTLRYANRAKNIQNRPKINEDPKDALLREYQEEIRRLKELLENVDAGESIDFSKLSNIDSLSNPTSSEANNVLKMKAEYDQKLQKLKGQFEQEAAEHAHVRAQLEQLNTNSNANACSSSTNAQHQALLDRLRKLQQDVVGGEKANDQALKQKRAQKKQLAETRRLALEQALRQVDDDEQLLVKAYGDLTEQLRVRTHLLKGSRRRLKELEAEIQDLHSEFEEERADYLETVRRLQRTLRLHSQLLEILQPLVRRDVNYADLNWVRSKAVWIEDQGRWQLPEIQFLRTRLPPTQPKDATLTAASFCGEDLELLIHDSNGNELKQNSLNDSIDSEPEIIHESLPGDRLLKRLQASNQTAADYFRPKRVDQLLNHLNHVSSIDENNNVNGHSNNQCSSKDLTSTFKNILNNSLSVAANGLSNRSFIVNSNQNSLNRSISNANRSINHSNGIQTAPGSGTPSLTINNKINENLNGSLSAGELFRKPIRLESIHTSNGASTNNRTSVDSMFRGTVQS